MSDSSGKVVIDGVDHYPHPNGGGLVAVTATVDSTVYVAPNARVCGSAKVYGDAQVYDDARVHGQGLGKVGPLGV